MSRPSLITLPAEILSEICRYLCWHCQEAHAPDSLSEFKNDAYDFQTDSRPLLWRREKTTLLSLTLTCRVLYVAAQPLLFHYVHTAGFSSYRFGIIHGSSASGLYCFVRTLLERPDLQRRVSAVELGCIGGLDGSDPHPPPRRMTEALDIQLQLENLELGGGSRSRFLRKMAEFSALTWLLLQLTPNLEHARFRVYSDADYLLFHRSQYQNEPATPLKSIKSLAFGSRPVRRLDLDVVAPILWLAPNLEVLHFHDCGGVHEKFPSYSSREKPPGHPVALPNLLELGLTNMIPTTAEFRTLVCAIGPKLSKVAICKLFPGLRDIDLDFDGVLAVLRPWTRTLRELTVLDATNYRGLFSAGDPPPSRLRHRLRGVRILRRFQALEILEAQAGVFDFNGRVGPMGEALSSTLPPSICRVRFWGYGKSTAALQGLVAAFVAGQFPRLRNVEIDDQRYDDYDRTGVATRELREVAACFRAAGVEFVVHDW